MKREEHAARVWLLLVGAALNRQLLTYKMVGERIGVPPQGLADILGHIMFYCAHHKFPPLTVLIVSEETGKPGSGLGTSDDNDKDRELVFKFKWIDQPAPRAAELAEFNPQKMISV